MSNRRNNNPRLLGQRKETLATHYLRARGLRLVQANYTCRVGEIDLVMLDGPGQLVFVEVRFRRSGRFGSPLETVGPFKQRKLRRAASHYLQRFPDFARLPCRFDVVAMQGSGEGQPHTVEWVKDAFH